MQMTQTELNEVVRLHVMWLCGEEGGERADLSRADLREANLRGVDLSRADLREADLRGADLRRANFSGADIDFSSWPLWCGGLDAKLCDKNAAMMAYFGLHYLQKAGVQLTQEQCDFVNSRFHRIGEVPELEVPAVPEDV